jgi:hypothetical protein
MDDQLLLWKASVESFIIRDVRKAVERDELETGLIILTLVGVECLGSYFTGEKADKAPFTAFMKAYFPAPYHNIADDIYASLRNGLMHDYTIKNDRFILVRNTDDKRHLQIVDSKIVFNRAVFASDFLDAWERFSTDVMATPGLATRVHRRIHAGRFLVVTDIPLPIALSSLAPPAPGDPVTPELPSDDDTIGRGTVSYEAYKEYMRRKKRS